ncbi:hypothetical protein BDV24DRAFT_44018 [Aspergillus arachidicola]|uniref:Uncharacterized protein n=1 Tax=Aspergillus arachidicola TaxID=656916 RepID=A0A5N6YD02_9EURO|nr:hypothetical protein BDV24DRAFT_44018 [Aspergillus arachidicola]
MFIWSNMCRVCFLFQDRNHKHADVCVYTACVQYRQESLKHCQCRAVVCDCMHTCNIFDFILF